MCIEVAADDGTRILLDLGMPLTAPDGGDFPWGTPQRPTEELIAEGVLVDVPGVFPHDPTAPDVAAIVLTHSHLDHYGLAHHAHPAIPVYGSEGHDRDPRGGARVLPRRGAAGRPAPAADRRAAAVRRPLA